MQDEDMAHFYSKGGSAANTIGKKFSTKRNYNGKLCEEKWYYFGSGILHIFHV